MVLSRSSTLDTEHASPIDHISRSRSRLSNSIAAYREAHPIYSRMIVRMLVRVNGLQGDPQEAVPREIPMLRLRAVRP